MTAAVFDYAAIKQRMDQLSGRAPSIERIAPQDRWSDVRVTARPAIHVNDVIDVLHASAMQLAAQRVRDCIRDGRMR